MQSRAVQAVSRTPVTALGDVPPELFLAFLASLPARVSEPLLTKWSATLSTKKTTH